MKPKRHGLTGRPGERVAGMLPGRGAIHVRAGTVIMGL